MDYSIPAPVGGWNAVDAYENMPQTDAISLQNMIPQETCVEDRKGCETIISSFLSIETIASYYSETDNQLLVAGRDDATNDRIWLIDIDAGTKSDKLGADATVNNWQTLNMNNLLIWVNGQDDPLTWDGTTLATYALTGTGFTKANMDGVINYKGRAYYWDEGKNSFWYCAAGAHAGTVTEFAIDFVTQEGGGITEICTWTRDSGAGMDDLFVVLLNTGETLIYSGDDPGASNWTNIGRFKLGAPITIRGSTNLASDRIIITQDGYINLSTALQQARLSKNNNVGEKIINAVKRNIKDYQDNFGWEIGFFPSQSLLIVNVPISATKSRQHVMNTNTGGWCLFDGWDALTFKEHDNQVYFGTSDGKLKRAFTGYNDDGDPIQGKCIPAFNNLGSPTHRKLLTLCTVVTNHSYPDYISVDSYAEFNLSGSSTLRLPPENTSANWDEPDWDEVYWDEDNNEDNIGIKAFQIPTFIYGYSIGIKVRHQSATQSIKYYSFKLKFKGGKS